MESTARFRDATKSPPFELDSFLLRNSKARVNGFDEWNRFSVPDDALDVTQFKGKFSLTRPTSSSPERAASSAPSTSSRAVTPHVHPVNIDVPLSDELVSARLSRIKRNIASAEHRRLVHASQFLKKNAKMSVREGHSLDTGTASAALSSFRDVSSPTIEPPPPAPVTPGQLKGHKFSVGSAEAEVDPTIVDSLLQPVDSAGYGLSSLISNNLSIAASETVPVINHSPQVHKLLMGWKLISPSSSRGGRATSSSRRRSSPGGPRLTLEQMGYMSESGEEDGRQAQEQEQEGARVSRRHVDAVLGIVRRNEKWRAKQEIALKAQKSACRNQSLDILCKPRPGTTIYAADMYSSSGAPLERQRRPATASDRTAKDRAASLWGDKAVSEQQPLLRGGYPLKGSRSRDNSEPGCGAGLLSQYPFGGAGGGGGQTSLRPADGEDEGRLIISTPDLPAIPSPRHGLNAWNPIGLIDQMNLFLKDDEQTDGIPEEELYLKEIRLRQKRKL